MQHRFSLGINPPKYQSRKTGASNATRLYSTLCRENLSLTGCSSAEPVSVLVQQRQISNIITIFTNCQKSQPFTLENHKRINSYLKQEFDKIPHEAIEKRYYKRYPDTDEAEYRIKIALDKDDTAGLGKNINIVEPWHEFKDININFKWKRLPNR